MKNTKLRLQFSAQKFVLGLLLPLSLTALIISLDYISGASGSFLGLAACVPIVSAVFSRPLPTFLVSVLVILGFVFYKTIFEVPQLAEESFVFLIFAVVTAVAVFASVQRERLEKERVKLANEAKYLEEASKLALLDQLTGIYNRHGVLETLQTEYRWPRSVVILDLDKLKQVNDTMGHQTGDEYIRIMSQRIQSAVSYGDIFGRWGGDEFIIILPLTQTQAQNVATRVITQVSSQPILSEGHTIYPRLSAGLAEWTSSLSLDDALSIADKALYEAKSSGGNLAILGTL